MPSDSTGELESVLSQRYSIVCCLGYSSEKWEMLKSPTDDVFLLLIQGRHVQIGSFLGLSPGEGPI